MRCQHCDYVLWTVRARECPECGQPFRPSDFEFPPSAVRFECPHCAASYFGTSPEGHLVPNRFQCAGCQRPISMDEMVLSPLAGTASGEIDLHQPNPWTAREPSLLPRWFRSAAQVLLSPGRFARTLRRTDDSGPAWRFAFLGWSIAAAASLLLGLAIETLAWGGGFIGVGIEGVVEVLLGVFGWFVGGVLGALAVAMLQHLALLMLAPRRASISSTLQVALYVSGAVSLIAIPGVFAPAQCVFAPVAAIWWWIASAVLLRHVHRTTGPRAALAGGVPLFLLAVACVGSVVLFVSMIGGAITPGAATVNTLPAPPTSASVSSEPLAYAIEFYGTAPDRTLFDGVLNGSVEWAELRDAITEGGTAKVLLGGIDIGAVEASDRPTLEALADAAAKRSPQGTLAYRVGSLVVYARGRTDQSVDGLLSIWRIAPDRFHVGTRFRQYQIDADGLATMLRQYQQTWIGNAGGTTPVIHPNDVVDLADTSDPFLPTAILPTVEDADSDENPPASDAPATGATKEQ